MKMIHELSTLLNMIKGFTAGYTSNNNKEMLVEKDGQVYKLTIEKVGSGTVADHFNEIDSE